MGDVKSGRFVHFKDTDGTERVGLALRLSSNEKANGETDDYVEVVGPLNVQLLNAEDVRDFNSDPKEDETRVVGGSSDSVGGLDMDSLPDDSKGPKGGPSGTKKG